MELAWVGKNLKPMMVDSGEEWLQVLGRMPESLETGTGKALGIEVVADEARLVVQLQEFD